MTESVVHGDKVLGYDSLTAFSVGLANGVLYGFNRLFARQNPADGKEAGLHDGVDAVAHLRLARDLVRIDQVELELLLDDGFLHRLRQVVPYLVRSKGGIQQKRGAGLGTIQNIHALDKLELVTGNKAGPGDQVGRTNRTRTETQM